MFKLLHRFIIQLLSFHLHDVAPSFPWCGRLLSPAEIGWRPKGTVGKNHRPLQNLLMLRSPDFSVETSVETWFPKKTFSWSWNRFLTIPGFQKKKVQTSKIKTGKKESVLKFLSERAQLRINPKPEPGPGTRFGDLTSHVKTAAPTWKSCESSIASNNCFKRSPWRRMCDKPRLGSVACPYI